MNGIVEMAPTCRATIPKRLIQIQYLRGVVRLLVEHQEPFSTGQHDTLGISRTLHKVRLLHAIATVVLSRRTH